MDINMQKMDGVTAARLIKTQYPDIAIVGLSADPKDYNVYAMEKAGAFEVFTKERAYEHLYDAIQRAVAANRSVLTSENAHSRNDGATS
jgi:DNA-binding NarL/FixJ family response regulator